MDLPSVRDFCIELSREAGKRLERYFRSQNFSQKAKGVGGDIVTQADTEIDAFIRHRLIDKFPAVQLMTEETTSGDYRSLKKKEWVFVVDPLDGTINFSRNNAHFGLSIGLLHRGQIQMCVAYVPMREELYWADAATEGAYLNGKRIQVSRVLDPKEMIAACDWSNSLAARETMLDILTSISGMTRRIKCFGSPVVDLCLLAKGDIDVYVHTRLRPWDITPAYIVQKAGGKVTNFQLQEWDIFRVDLLATNSLLHSAVEKILPIASSSEIQ